MLLRAVLALALLSASNSAVAQVAGEDATTSLVARLEEAAGAGNTAAISALGSAPDVPGLVDFASFVTPAPTRFVLKLRDRAAVGTAAERLLLEVFSQYGSESMITTWRVEVLTDGTAGGPRRISSMERLTTVRGLHRLALNPAKQFHIRNLTVRGTDLTLEIPSGHAFVAEIPDGPTAVVLLGRGRMHFAPADAAERTQIRIFGGEDSLNTEFTAAFLRVRPGDFDETFDASALVPATVAQNELRRANDVFEDYIGQSLQLDLTDLSRERWSLIPGVGDLVVEIRTRRLGSLTYARSMNDPEDITLFDRRRKRNIALYASQEKLAARGPFYSEDDLVDYDVQHYDVDVALSPSRLWIDGTAHIRLKVRSYVLTALTLRLAEPLAVRSVMSPELGRLLHLRVVGQNSVVVSLPDGVSRGTELSLNVVYGGRLEPQQIDREGITVSQQQQPVEQVYIPIEPQYIYSNRSYWYPQATVTDYATARIRVAVPPDFGVVASGTPAGEAAAPEGDTDQDRRGWKLFAFETDRPVRYLACVVSRFSHVSSRQLTVPGRDGRVTAVVGPAASNAADDAEAGGNSSASAGPAAAEAAHGQSGDDRDSRVTLNIDANPRQVGRARSLGDRAAAIFQFYAGILGEAPYPTFTLAVCEDELPGGHSPGYFALVNQPPPAIQSAWRNDPVAFDNYPSFFLAHEVAHQWWGQGVGWKNYHEQWLSEGFSQYFAALYAEKDRGTDLLESMLRQMGRWAEEQSDQGPVYLGYRLGHIKGDTRVFRALVYNKGAMVLHMLRRLIGDEAFFAGVRQFYGEWKYKKAGTDDLRKVMERVSGRDLSSFFGAWIYGSAIPILNFTATVADGEARVRLEHLGQMVPVPVTVSITYADGQTEDAVVAVTEQAAETTMALKGPVRSIRANRDYAAVAEIKETKR